VEHPGCYAHYRLRITEASGDRLALAELELLAQ
jgi:hypothetical protein